MTNEARTNEPRIWMNVTTSANWNRPAVGIVRVEQELFKALSERLGDRLRPCVLRDGQLVPYSGSIGSAQRDLIRADEESFVWPDPSYDFPQSVSLDPMPLPRSPVPRKRPSGREFSSNDQIGFGDVIISVGLDWDWQDKRLDAVLYDLKTKRDVKVITCCYDLIPVLYPQYCVGDVAATFKEYFTNLTWASSGMLCISKRSEADYRALSTELGMPFIPTKVMLLGNKLPEAGEDVSESIESICDGRFVLFVSTIERRKNHEVLYKALHILAERRQLDPEFKLVFVGMPGWGVADLLKDIELDPLVRDHIVQFHHTNDAELRMLYEACDFFVYPSFYEGWGLPVAEALALGKFVIASDRGSIPEVGGDLVEYADPWNASQWADLLQKFWGEPKLVEERTNIIKSAYHPIHWDETATAVLELMGDLTSTSRREITLAPGYDMRTLNGVPFGPKIVLVNSHGNLCHGPYYPLSKGPVRISLELERTTTDRVELLFKFTIDKGKSIVRRETRRLSGKKLKSNIGFSFDLKHDVDDFEIVIECPQKSNLSLNIVSIIHN